MSELLQVSAALTRAALQDQVSVLATVVQTEGSTYRRIGVRVVALADGSRVGAVSAGCDLGVSRTLLVSPSARLRLGGSALGDAPLWRSETPTSDRF